MLKISPTRYLNINFKSNLKNGTTGLKRQNCDSFEKSSPNLQVLPLDLYFIRMEEYDTDEEWARKMINHTYVISDMIRNNEDFSDIWIKTASGIAEINDNPIYSMARESKNVFFINHSWGRGCEYYKKYLKKIRENNGCFIPKANEEYKDALTARIDGSYNICISYGMGNFYDYISLKSLVKKEYNKLKSIKNPTSAQINCSVATIHWLIAQATPFVRGSDSFANVFTKAIYHSYGMKLSPIKEGKSFDFEAFCSDLDEFINKYPNLFEIKPSKNPSK